MSKSKANTDVLIKQKFENFAPLPSNQVWEGIQAGIVVSPSFLALYWKGIAAAAVFIAFVITGIWFYSAADIDKNNQSEITETNNITSEDNEGSNDKVKIVTDDNDVSPEIVKQVAIEESVQDQNPAEKNQNEDNVSSDSPSSLLSNSEKQFDNGSVDNKSDDLKHAAYSDETNAMLTNKLNSSGNSGQGLYKLNNVEITRITGLSGIEGENPSLYSGSTPIIIEPTLSKGLLEIGNQDFTLKKKKWSIGFYFTPEMMLNNFDSVEVLTNYSVGIEPTYVINNHLFIRFGIGTSYSRDRGFAKLDYLSNDLLGTYDYVYDVTFDSIDGQVVPTYHTTNVEVWDTVRHLEISSITNNYVYLQAPVLFGYYSSNSKFKWYLYGGPAFNLMLSKQIEQPIEGIDYVDIINLQNELPERSPYYFQLWLGAGIEYKAFKNLGVAFEPNYRYYFKNVFNEPPYSKSGLSGLSLRIGLVYTIQ